MTSSKTGTDLHRELQYSRVSLNRADELRRSDDEVNALWCNPECRIVPIHQSKSLFRTLSDGLEPGGVIGAVTVEPVVTLQSDLTDKQLRYLHRTFLGLDKSNRSYFSVQLDDDNASQWVANYPDARFLDLRSAGATLDPDIASILSYARGLSHWQSVSAFCARCGGNNQPESAGHSMRCQQCESQIFPRTDPAVIMLVEHEDQQGNKKCLLGRNPAWAEGCYSTLAGFVESGESLEAAVIREVFEESGIVVENPKYIASQPWPFPQSIMLGFVARAVSSDIVLDTQELANAGWFSAAEVAQFGEWADEGDGLKLPRVDSIARYLIDSWVAEQSQTAGA